MLPPVLYTIHYRLHHQIDKKKWDACLQTCGNPIIYASVMYLDGMCKHWNALVLNDYEAIMPLPWNKKLGVSYIYSPYYVIGGGVFGKNITTDIFIQFIKAIPAAFLYVDLNLNESNFFIDKAHQNNINLLPRNNTFLNLFSDYETIFSNYSKLAKRKIKSAGKSNFYLNKKTNVPEVIELYSRHYKTKDSVITKFDFTQMIALLQTGLAEQTKTYILSFPDGNVAAFYLLLWDNSYVYWLIGGSTEAGKKMGAFYYLTDQVIKDFAGSKRVFRFEGSDHAGINFFNNQFGGYPVLYPRLKLNRLPWPLRLLKK